MVKTEVLIEERTSLGATVARLQKYPLTTAPRVGEELGIEGIEGEFIVVKVSHSFMTSGKPRHVVWVTVERKG